MLENYKTKISSSLILLSIITSLVTPLFTANASTADDASAYEKYPLHSKYDKKKKYGEYKKFQKIKLELGFDDAEVRLAAKDGYDNYRLYLKDKLRYRSFARYLPQYNAYKKYKKYSEASKYKKYKKYDNKAYDKYKKYCSSAYEAGYNRYKVFMNDINNVTTNPGPEIRVGLWSKNHLDAAEGADPFRITANKPFTVTKCDDVAIGTIPTTSNLRVAYESGGQLTVFNEINSITRTTVNEKVCLQAADGNNLDMIFDVNTPTNISKAGYEQYRGKIKLQHSYSTDNYELYSRASFADNDTEHAQRRIWVINILPLEQYMWGYGEMSSGGVENHAKTMIVAGRSYARWYLDIPPTDRKWGDYTTRAGESGEGFDISAYSFSQIYNGYDYETTHSFIADAARKTNGVIMKYGTEYVLAAYSSFTDGNTRALAGYPYLLSVPDPYGKNSSMTTDEMVAAGNHMWGMSASGALNLATNYGWSWTRILPYYYSGVSIVKEY
jgi:hypothetical protein